ncbi:MAG: hypothetical protein HDS15_01365 [Bacteroides sp.]|nr:hypothetical protein [Bacteroides sp.]
MNYPEIYTSNKILAILNSIPELPTKPQSPRPPKQPVNPGKYNSGGNRGCFMFMLIGAIILFFVVQPSENVNKSILILSSIILFILSLFLFKTSWDKRSHKQKQKQYWKDLASFPAKRKTYELNLARYKDDLSKYEAIVRKLTNPNHLQSYRAKKIKQLLSNIARVKLTELSSKDVVKKGASEDFFIDYLKKLGFNVMTGYKLPVGKSFYYPDLIIEHDGLYIDVEIDEPYAVNDGTPIHYATGHNSSIDKERNEYFNRMGIEVIRFSEEQIFRNTETCARVIRDYIQTIKQGKKYSLTLNNQFTIQKWSRDESIRMAHLKFRRTYVPFEYQKNIDKEEQRSYQRNYGKKYRE